MGWYDNLPSEDETLARSSPAGLAVIHTQHFSADSGQRWVLYPYMRLIVRRFLPILLSGGKGMLFMPVRHGKSLFSSVYAPAWFIMLNQTKNVILTSYSSDLSADFSAKAREVVRELGHLFGVRIHSKQNKRDHWQVQWLGGDGEWHDGGHFFSAGVDGSLPGRGGHLIVMDDVVRGHKDTTRTMMEKAYTWYRSVLETRQEPGCAMLLVMTRWAQADLAGRLQEDEADEWDVLKLPALALEEDPLGRAPNEALCPARYPREELEKRRDSSDEGGLIFSALYQQDPMPTDGAIFKAAQIGRWRYQGDAIVYGNRTIAASDLVILFATIDPALKDKEVNDPTGFIVWAITVWGDLLAMEDHTARMSGSDDLLPVMRRVWRAHESIVFYVEDQAHGTEIMRACMRERLPVLPLKADRDKVTRAIGAQPAFAAGEVFLPEEGAEAHTRELLEFPGGRHDDRVDCTSYAVQAWRELVAHLGEAGYARDLADALAKASRPEDEDENGDEAENELVEGGHWRP